MTGKDSEAIDDTVTINVETNIEPVANAGGDQTATLGSVVTFDGSGSTDANTGDSITYSWADSAGTVLNSTVTFTKNDFTEGEHAITLTVTDTKGGKHSDTVTITITTDIVSRLNDTGINFSGNAESGNNAESDNENENCAGGAAVAQQDCSHGRDADENNSTDGHAGFSFIKISSDGTELPESATEWSCVKDTVSNLIWEVKNNEDGLRDEDWTYVNNSNLSGSTAPVAPADPVACGPLADESTCDTEAYKDAVNEESLCGASDWRIPTIRELLNLVNYGNASPSIDVVYFSDGLSGAVWSSSPAVGGGAWAIDFGAGNNGRDARDHQMAVRLVRDAQ